MIVPALRFVAGVLTKHWGKAALVAADEYVLDGTVRKAAVDGLQTGAKYISKKENRDAIKESVTGAATGVKDAAGAISDAVDAVKNPEKKLGEVLMGSDEKNPDGSDKEPGLLSKIFRDKDGSINWVNTALTAATAFWGGGKLKNLFGGKDGGDGEGLFGGGALKLGIMAAVGYLIYKNFDSIKSFFGNIMDGFNKKASEIGGSHGVNIGMDPTGRTKTLAEMDLSTPPAKTPLGQEFQGKTMKSPSVTRAKPAASGAPNEPADDMGLIYE